MGQGHIREGEGGEGDSLPCLILPLLDSCKSATCMHPVAGWHVKSDAIRMSTVSYSTLLGHIHLSQ